MEERIMTPEAKIEALLYAAGEEGVSLKHLSEILDTSLKRINESIEKLDLHYNSDKNSGLTLLFVGNQVLLVTKKEMEPILKQYAQSPLKTSLSNAALEILSIIAYKQPLTRMEIDEIRGVHSGGSLQKLILRGLIKEKGRLDAPGRPVIYGTTSYFLNYFGLENINDLPPLPDINEHSTKELDLFNNSEHQGTEIEENE